MNPRVSIILPAYNCRKYLQEAIASVLAQTYSDFELIVINDGSTDDSRAIIDSIVDKRIAIIDQPNQGYPVAMNSGLSKARGHYIARMDADDIISSQRIEKQVSFLDSQLEFALVGTRYGQITPRGYHTAKAFYATVPWTIETWESILHGRRGFADASVMFRRNAAMEAGFYRTYQRTGQDVDLWLRLLERGWKGATLNEPLYYQRLRGDAISLSLNTAALAQIPRLLARERREIGSDSVERGEGIAHLLTPAMRESAHQLRVRGFWRSAALCMEARDFRAGLAFARLAFQHDPQLVRKFRGMGTIALSCLRGFTSQSA